MRITPRTKVYIAGPMRGYEFYNFPAFDEARDQLNQDGFEAVSPADLDRHAGFDVYALERNHDWTQLPESMDLDSIVRRDMEALLQCDAIYKLPDWEGSTGARAEVAIAEWLGLEDITPEESIAAEADRLVDGSRGGDYGHPLDDFAKTAVFWSLILKQPVSPEQVGLCMIGVKMSRQLNKPKRDNLVDIAGYAKTVDMVLREKARRMEDRRGKEA